MSRHVDGLRMWLLQRVSAVYLAVFFVYLLVHFLLHPDPDYGEWRDWIGRPLVGVAFAGFTLALLVHGWVGMRDVVLDYVRTLHLRLMVLSLIALIFIGCGLWALQILLLAAG